MSPTAFKQHVTHLVSVFKRCDELCEAIYSTRRVGSKHESLDNLHIGVNSSNQAIQIEYSALRKVFGSRFDLGDDLAREALKSNIRSAEDVERRLAAIASRRNDGLPGFKDMLRIIHRVEDSVAEIFAGLGQRLETPIPAAKPAEKKSEKSKEEKKKEEKKEEKKKAKKVDEVIISIKEWDRYMEHLKNSWSESLVSGRILYVNAFDESKNTWELPRGGFIKTLPVAIPKPSTRPPPPVFEERRYRETSPIRRTTRDDRRSSRRYEDDQWVRSDGW